MTPRKSDSSVAIGDIERKCFMALRRYELEAYSAVVTALRAEGSLNESKMVVLKQLQEVLGISLERHKAEVRRAANDENLAFIAMQIQGYACDDNWQKEGHRPLGILKHPLPITSLTKLADEVADTLVNHTSSSHTHKDIEEKVVLPPIEPYVAVSNELFKDLQKSADDENSSDQKQCEMPAIEEIEDVKLSQNPQDSIVHLPSGRRVRVGPKGPPVKVPEVSSSSMKPALEKPIITSESSVSASSTNSKPIAESITESKKDNPNINSDVLEKPVSSKQHLLATKTSTLFKHEQDIIQSRMSKCIDEQYVLHPSLKRFDRESADFGRRNATLCKPFIDDSWATKHNVTTEARNKRKLPRSSLSMNPKKFNKSMRAVRRSSSPSDKKARISGPHRLPTHSSPMPQRSLASVQSNVNIYPKPSESYPSHMKSSYSPHRDLTFLNELKTTYPQIPSSPQRVFRPSMQIAGSIDQTKPTASSGAFAPSKPHLHSVVETQTGLAPVSTIISQVTAQSDLQSSAIMTSYTEKKFASGKPLAGMSVNSLPPAHHVIDMTGEKSDLRTESLSDVLVPSIHSEIFTSSVSKLSDLVDKNLRAHAPSIKSASSQSSTATSLKLSASQSTTISSTSTSRLPSSRPATSAPLKLDNLNVSAYKPPPVIPVKPLERHPAPSSVSNSSNSIVTSSSRLSGGSPTNQGSLKPGMSPIAAANIIKVTPRPLAKAGSQIVTQISGARITKTFSGVAGNVRPSIIVVRQAAKKQLAAGTGKVLEIPSSKSPQAKVKAVTATSKPVIKATTLIRSADTKVQPGSVIPSNQVESSSNSGVHKVITKGKMRQLVLKPTTAIASSLRHPGQDSKKLLTPNPSSLESVFKSEQDPTLHAASTIKALAAMQREPHLIASNSPQQRTEATFKMQAKTLERPALFHQYSGPSGETEET